MKSDFNGKSKNSNQRRCLVSVCFDLLHSGHIHFVQQAACFARLTVALGSDATVADLKGHTPKCNGAERAFMLRALACVIPLPQPPLCQPFVSTLCEGSVIVVSLQPIKPHADRLWPRNQHPHDHRAALGVKVLQAATQRTSRS
jgi:cytidyltransferase-like protein